MLNFKKNLVYWREKKMIIIQMSWSNVLRTAGSDYCVNNFPGTFVDFRFLRDLLKK